MNVTDLSVDLQKEFKQRQYFAQMDVLEQTSSLLKLAYISLPNCLYRFIETTVSIPQTWR